MTTQQWTSSGIEAVWGESWLILGKYCRTCLRLYALLHLALRSLACVVDKSRNLHSSKSPVDRCSRRSKLGIARGEGRNRREWIGLDCSLAKRVPKRG